MAVELIKLAKTFHRVLAIQRDHFSDRQEQRFVVTTGEGVSIGVAVLTSNLVAFLA